MHLHHSCLVCLNQAVVHLPGKSSSFGWGIELPPKNVGLDSIETNAAAVRLHVLMASGP